MDEYVTIDWAADDERVNREKLNRLYSGVTKTNLRQAARSWIALALAGLLVGIIAVVISQATSLLVDLRDGHCRSAWYLNESLCCLGELEGCDNWAPHAWYFSFFIYLGLSLFFITIASFLVCTLAPTAAGSGISEIKCIVSGFYSKKFLSWQTLVTKTLALPLTIAAGMSVGKEGPSVHYAACVGNFISTKIFRPEDYRRQSDLIVACCAAGVAVAFGSPIGGVLFALEEIMYELRLTTLWHAYFCCLIATSVVKLLNPYRTGHVVLFKVEYDRMWHAFELPFFAIIGIFGGIVGQLIINLNLRVSSLRKKYWGKWCITEAFVLVLFTSIICYFNMYLHIDMTKSMQILFHECEHGEERHPSCDGSNKGGIMLSLAYAFVVRLALLLVSYGAAKVPAGIFVPSMAIGALFGRLVGIFVWALISKFPNSNVFSSCDDADNCINPGAYALLGAGALLAGVMHITLTVVVIIFELTGALHYIIPAMLVVGTTRIISALYKGEGIADMAIKRNHLPFIEPDVDEAETKIAADIMVKAENVVSIGVHDSLLVSSEFKTYPVLDRNRELVGSVVDNRVIKAPITVSADMNLATLRSIFVSLGPHTVYVTENGYLLGLITRNDLLRAIREPDVIHTNLEMDWGTKIQHFCESIPRIPFA